MPDEPKWKELLPPEGHPKVGDEAYKLFAEVLQDKINLGLLDKWRRFYELRKNKHWKNQGATGINLVTANLIYTHIQRVCNTMTDNDPTFNLVAMDEAGASEEIYDNLQKAAESWWIDTEQSDDFARSVVNGETYGICIEKVIFNPDLEGGMGEVETVVVDPYHFGFYPCKMTDPKHLQQAMAVLHFYPLPVREVKRIWGEKAKDVKPEEDLMKDLGDSRREISGMSRGWQGMLVTINNAVKTLINYDSGVESENKQAIVCEIWLKDYSDPDKYPGNIRLVTTCNAGKIVLEDKPNPSINMELWKSNQEEARKTYLADKFPFTAATPIPDTSNAWGMCDLEQIEQINVELNKALSQLILFKDRAARQKIINPRTSGVQNDEFTNASGVISPANAQEAQQIRWLGPPEPNMDIDKAIVTMKDIFFLVVGTFELDQAQVAGRDVIAYKAIAALMERAATMMRGKIRSYGRVLRERGRMYLSHVMNYYTEERWIQFNDSKTGRMVAKRIPPGQEMIVPAKLTVVTGSTLPVSRVQRREEAIGLAAKGMIDQQALLEAVDWPNRNDVIQRMQLGALGNALKKLQAIGVPVPVIQAMGDIMSLEDKEFEKMAKQGELPTAQDLLTVMMGQPSQGPDPTQQAEQAEKAAKAQKLNMEAQLTAEKILTERVKQQQILNGIQFDEDMLAMERAKIVHELQLDLKGVEHEERRLGMAERSEDREDFRATHEAVAGVAGHQLEAARFQREGELAGMEHERENKRLGLEEKKISLSRNKPGYNERGMKSNNKAK